MIIFFSGTGDKICCPEFVFKKSPCDLMLTYAEMESENAVAVKRLQRRYKGYKNVKEKENK